MKRITPILALVVAIFTLCWSPPAMGAANFAVNLRTLLQGQVAGSITAGNAAGIPSPWNASSLTPRSWGVVGTNPGSNTVTLNIDASSSYSGASPVLYSVPFGSTTATQIPLTTFQNDNTRDFLGISAGATGKWTGTVSGAGSLYLILPSGGSGTLVWQMSVGPGNGAQPQPGGNSSTIASPNFVEIAKNSLGVDVVAGDSNGLVTNPNGVALTYSQTGSQSGNATLQLGGTGVSYIDMRQWQSISIQVIAFGTSVTQIALQQSIDTTNWTGNLSVNVDGTTGTTTTMTTATPYLYSGNGPYLRLNAIQAETGSTTTVKVYLKGAQARPTFTTLGSSVSTIGVVNFSASTTGGSSTYPTAVGSALVSGALTQIKAGASSWYGHNLTNPNTATVYVCFFNVSSITYGTTVPLVTVVLNALPTATAPFSQSPPEHLPIPVAFGTAMYYTVSTSLSSLTSPTNPVIGTVFAQ